MAGGVVKDTEEEEEYIYAVKDDEVNIHAALSQAILNDYVFDLFLFHFPQRFSFSSRTMKAESRWREKTVHKHLFHMFPFHHKKRWVEYLKQVF